MTLKAYHLMAAAALLMSACTGSDTGYDASGVFEATEVIVSAKTAGEISTFLAEEGQTVKGGQELGCIDTMQLHWQRLQLLSNLSATESKHLDEARQVASIRQQISNLQRERQRFAELVKENAANQKQVDDIDYQISVLNRQLAATSEQIGSNNSSLKGQKGSIRAQMGLIDQRMEDSRIVSPVSGTVLTKYAEQGEFAAPGKALFKVADTGSMELRAYVTADQLTQLRIGQEVKVFADKGTDGRKEYKGQICWISDKAEFTPKTIQTRDERANLVYALKIRVKNDGYIKMGMYGDVVFHK